MGGAFSSPAPPPSSARGLPGLADLSPYRKKLLGE